MHIYVYMLMIDNLAHREITPHNTFMPFEKFFSCPCREVIGLFLFQHSR